MKIEAMLTPCSSILFKREDEGFSELSALKARVILYSPNQSGSVDSETYREQPIQHDGLLNVHVSAASQFKLSFPQPFAPLATQPQSAGAQL